MLEHIYIEIMSMSASAVYGVGQRTMEGGWVTTNNDIIHYAEGGHRTYSCC